MPAAGSLVIPHRHAMTSIRTLVLAVALAGAAPGLLAQATAVPATVAPAATDSVRPKPDAKAAAARKTTARKKSAKKVAKAPAVTVDSEARLDSILDARWPVKGPDPLPGSILPGKRIVAYYGNPMSKRMGVLGEYEPEQMLKMLDAEVKAWTEADPTTPVQPALHLIAVVAQAGSGADGKYRARMPDTLIERVAAWAATRNALVFLDLQVGKSTLAEELPRLEKFLSRPNFHLGIDPEFSMKAGGLAAVPNPSELFLAGRPSQEPGSIVVASMDGTRPIFCELQALATPVSFGAPRRTAHGVDHTRVSLIAAVMERKIGMHLVTQDIFVNLVGGMSIQEPAVDLPLAIALASSVKNMPIAEGTAVAGEVGLAGEVRAITGAEARLAEAARIGFTRLVCPKANVKSLPHRGTVEVVGVASLAEALEALF